MAMTGTWEGEYTYGPEYGPHAGRSVPFRMSLSQSAAGHVSGYVRDDQSRGGMPERGRIAGTLRGGWITFVKTVPTAHSVLGASGLEDLGAQLSSQMEAPVSLEGPHRVHYEGDLGPDGATVLGEWKVLPRRISVQGRRLETRGSWTGTWSARRVADELSAV